MGSRQSSRYNVGDGMATSHQHFDESGDMKYKTKPAGSSHYKKDYEQKGRVVSEGGPPGGSSQGRYNPPATNPIPDISRPILDPFAIKIPRRKGEGSGPIFDRPELKAPPEPAPMEPVFTQQDVRFTGAIPATAPPPAQNFMQEPLPPHVGSYFEHNPPIQFPPLINPSLGPNMNPFHAPPPNFQIPTSVDQQRMGDYQFGGSPPMQNAVDDGISYRYPPDDSGGENHKGPRDLRYDLDTRRRRKERRSMTPTDARSSRSQSPDQRRNQSRSPVQRRYKRDRSSSYERSNSPPARSSNWKSSRGDYDRDRYPNSHDRNKNIFAPFRTRGYLGKNFIPGYRRTAYKDLPFRPRARENSTEREEKKQPKPSTPPPRGSPRSTWTHDMYENSQEDGKKSAKDKDSKKAKKAKKSKKNPSVGDVKESTSVTTSGK